MGFFVNPFAYSLGGGQGVSAGGAGPDSTTRYVEVTIAASQISSTLTNFPTYVDLSDMPAAFFTNVQSDGGDIRVTESDGTTQAPVDLVAIDTGTSTGELHFLASSLSSSTDTVYRIYYDAGGGASQPGAATTYGSQSVWTDYQMVLHDGGGTDAAGNYDGTANGGVTFGGATGKLGDATEYDGTDDYSNHGDGMMEGVSETTLSVWIKPDAVSGNQRIFHKNGTWTNYLPSATPGGFITLNYDNISTVRTGGSAIATGAWSHIFATAKWSTSGGNGARLYINGSSNLSADSSNGSDATPDSADPGLVGIDEDLSTNVYDGLIDELRLRAEFMSAAWITSEYTNQNTPTTFYSVGSEQSA